MTDARRRLPSVGVLLDNPALEPLLSRAPRSLVADAVRSAIAAARGDPAHAPNDAQAWATAVAEQLAAKERPSLRPALNATGVVLHTNLGRAPLTARAIQAIADTAAGACNLEFDLDTGERGSRYVHAVALLRELTGAEDAIVVNNCASALVLALNSLASGREAIVSRGELIEIGGSFRVPEIMAKSGAALVEVGTTNRTHLGDYRDAIGDATGAIVKVHRSNFEVRGFVAEATLRELAPVARERALPLLFDFGSGLLVSLDEFGLRGEPTARDAVRDGATLVLMSGDKLLGGPQAGIILGSAKSIAACRRNPLARALRVDKLTLAALEATLALYRDPSEAIREIPTLAMLTAPLEAVAARADAVSAELRLSRIPCEVIETEASVGGGAFPTARIPSRAVALDGDAEEIERRLRHGTPPVIGRIGQGRVLLDVRSVPAAQDAALVRSVRAALA
ncbi:MAG: L-seryl-tRNA(Sec) selenium transferase [Geminicoccaceae bacterium]|jgi:L-seryl-tRNA(Ser) seleniumtransferase|nr:L-seryl-tRNA(Sec) selenium transferase [Geminicoccaceae bacterium]